MVLENEHSSNHYGSELIEDILSYLKQKSSRNYILVLTGINTGFRISDILKLRVRDVTGTHITIREKKTRKEKSILITPELKRELKEYIKDMALMSTF